MSLKIQNLTVSIDNKEIIHGLNLEVKKGEIHAIMGPNGSGKSTLANVLAGHPKYSLQGGEIFFNDVQVDELDPHKRAKLGLFLSMQYPPEIAGVTITSFLRLAVEAKTGVKQPPVAFFKKLKEAMKALGMNEDFASRYVNSGFSGGEKKRAEILQLLMLQPTCAILDETDSGLDVDALRIVANGINEFRSAENSVLLITHYNRILEYVVPDVVHIMVNGKIVKSGGKELAVEIEKNGYKQYE